MLGFMYKARINGKDACRILDRKNRCGGFKLRVSAFGWTHLLWQAKMCVSENGHSATLKMNMEQYRNRHGKIWLNVASSNLFIEDFLNLDSCFLIWFSPLFPLIKNRLNPTGARAWLQGYRDGLARGFQFKYCNCAFPLKFPPNSVDHILASHFLEHLYPETVNEVLAGFYRVLKPGGTLHAIVPDLEIRSREYIGKLGKPEAADEFVTLLYFRLAKRPSRINRLFAAMGFGDHEHCWMYDQSSFRKLLRSHGFVETNIEQSPSSGWRHTEWGQLNVVMVKPRTDDVNLQ
jgi:SAM-dependent methyltransferase